jgi:hypothetical protein
MKPKPAHMSMILSLFTHLESNCAVRFDDPYLFKNVYAFMYATSKIKSLAGILPHYLNTLVKITVCFLSQLSISNASDLSDLVRLYENLPENSKKHCPFMISTLIAIKLRLDLKSCWKQIVMKLLDACDEHG